MIEKLDIAGNPFVGIFGFSTEKVTLIRPDIGKRKRILEEALKTTVVETTMARTDLVGLFACGNSHGIAVPYFVEKEEVKLIEDIPVFRFMQKYTALANLILVNDFGCVASPLLERKALEDAFGVPVEHATIAGFRNMGAVAFATNKVVYLHPEVSEEEMQFISEMLHVPCGKETANMGIPYLRSCMLGNSHGLFVGSWTTGIEMNNLEDVLEVIV
jgi:translation initiation factor 6